MTGMTAKLDWSVKALTRGLCCMVTPRYQKG